MMTTSHEHEPMGISQDSTEAWRVTMALARYERRQRGERYLARHRWAPADGAEAHDTTQRSA
jgi:hypothetical protein